MDLNSLQDKLHRETITKELKKVIFLQKRLGTKTAVVALEEHLLIPISLLFLIFQT